MVTLALLAKVLQDVARGQEQFGEFHGHRFGEHDGILDGHLQVQMSEIAAPDALVDLHRLTVLVADRVKMPYYTVERASAPTPN